MVHPYALSPGLFHRGVWQKRQHPVVPSAVVRVSGVTLIAAKEQAHVAFFGCTDRPYGTVDHFSPDGLIKEQAGTKPFVASRFQRRKRPRPFIFVWNARWAVPTRRATDRLHRRTSRAKSRNGVAPCGTTMHGVAGSFRLARFADLFNQ